MELWLAIAAVASGVLFVLITRISWLRRIRFGPFKPKEVRLRLAGIEVNLTPDYSTLRIAHQAWAELVTRKAGLEIDDEHDVIIEIYDSWYALFGELRRLLKSIPAEELKGSHDAQELVNTILNVMNGPLRQHLTRWQAKFGRWYARAAIEDESSDPQEIQTRYPAYAELLGDLKLVNVELVELTTQLGTLVSGGPVSAKLP